VRKLRAKVVEAMITPTSSKVRQPLPTLGFTVPLPPPALSPNKGWGGARMKAPCHADVLPWMAKAQEARPSYAAWAAKQR